MQICSRHRARQSADAASPLRIYACIMLTSLSIRYYFESQPESSVRACTRNVYAKPSTVASPRRIANESLDFLERSEFAGKPPGDFYGER